MDFVSLIFNGNMQAMKKPFHVSGMAQIPFLDDPMGVVQILRKARQIFLQEPNVIRMMNGNDERNEITKSNQNFLGGVDQFDPVLIIGNLNGYVFNLYKTIMDNGLPPTKKYLFLGNIIGEGKEEDFSFETLLFVLALKVRYPKDVFVIRGVNEHNFIKTQDYVSPSLLRNYFTPQIQEELNDLFKSLPLAAHVCETFYCVNHGFPRDLNQVDQINRFKMARNDSLSLEMFYDGAQKYIKDEAFLDCLFEQYNLRMIIMCKNFVEGGVMPEVDGRINYFYTGYNANDISSTLMIYDQETLDAIDIEEACLIKKSEVKYFSIDQQLYQSNNERANSRSGVTFNLNTTQDQSSDKVFELSVQKGSISCAYSSAQFNHKPQQKFFLGNSTAISILHPIHSKMHSYEKIKKIYRFNPGTPQPQPKQISASITAPLIKQPEIKFKPILSERD